MDITKISQAEKDKIEVIRSVFAGDEPLLKILRKIVLGFDLTADEAKSSKLITGNKKLVDIIEANLNPRLTGDEEIFMVNDIWFQLNIKDKSKEEAILLMKAVDLNQSFMADAIKRLNGDKVETSINDLSYAKDKTEDENLIRVLARNITISGIEGCLRGFKTLAGEKGETLEELGKRLAKNSSK